jgi:hypothetical protein
MAITIRKRIAHSCILACLALVLANCALPASHGPNPPGWIGTPVPSETPIPEVIITDSTQITKATPTFSSYEGLYAWLPLEISNTWIYSYTAYIGETHATWRISDTVLETQQLSKYKIARIQRQVTFISGSSSQNFPDVPVSEEFWYLTDGSYLYKQYGSLDVNAITDSWLELIYPITTGECWYPDPDQRTSLAMATPASMEKLPGCRYLVDEEGDVETTVGVFTGCYSLVTAYNSGPTLTTFCPSIGIVGWKYGHNGSNFGYEAVIIGYSLETP